MSKSSKQRRSDDEFKPPSAKKAKHKPEEHQSVQRIRLLDLIKCNYLCAGEEVFVKEQEGVITDRGTIKVLSGSGYIEYSNPTSWTKQVTGRENGGWGQIRLKSSKQTLSSIKEQYQKSLSSMEYIEDSESKQITYHPPEQLNPPTTTTSPPTSTDTAPSDLTLPLKVRFINDEDRVFKIIWVSSDFKEFHTEYQGTLYSNLADFVNKIFEDFQQKPADPNAPPQQNLRFDELMYELSPGKWVRLAGNLSDFIAQQGNHHGTDQVSQPYQQQPQLNMGTQFHQPHLLNLHQTQPLSFSHSQPTSVPEHCTNRTINNSHSTCNNSTTSITSIDANHHMGDSSTNAHNASFDDYATGAGDEDDDEDNEDYTYFHGTGGDQRRRRNSFNKSPRSPARWRARSAQLRCYKCLVYVESEDAVPIRVNSFGPTNIKDMLHVIFTESGIKHHINNTSNTNNISNTNNANTNSNTANNTSININNHNNVNSHGAESDFYRDYHIDIEDQDFGGVKIAFPRTIANFPTKCKIIIRRKYPTEIAEKDNDKGDSSNNNNNDSHPNEDKGDKDLDKENDTDKQTEKLSDEDAVGKDSSLLV